MARGSSRAAIAVFIGATMALALLVHITTDAPKATLLQKLEDEGEDLRPDEAEVEDEAVPEAAPSTDPELIYSAYQPVYGRCKKVVDMPAFSELIAKSCGNIHEYENVAYPCVQAMQQSSQKMGCCWETVLEGYATLYPEAAHAWRMWQGTLSGKTGVTFEDQSCGESTGEKPYNDLKSEVGQLEDVIQQQQYDIAYLESQMTASNKPAYDPYDPWGGYYSDPYGYDYTYYKGKKGIPQLHQPKRHASRPARLQSKAFFPPYHPAAAAHANAYQAVDRAGELADRAQEDRSASLLSAYKAQRSHYAAAMAAVEAHGAARRVNNVLDSPAGGLLRMRAAVGDARSSDALTREDQNDSGANAMLNAGVRI